MQSTASDATGSQDKAEDSPKTRQRRITSAGRQRTVIIGLVGIAVVALVVAAKFSAPTTPSAAVLTGTAADGGGDRSDQENGQSVLLVDPVEGWLPAAGDGTACSERVGIDLIPGYAATLQINGVDIADEDMNNYIGPDGAQDAGASIGEFTWGPEEDCPHGELLRPTDNRVIACVYRVEEGRANCRTTARPDAFDF